MDFQQLIALKKETLKPTEFKPSYERLADYLVITFDDEDSRRFYELACRHLGGKRIRFLANQAKYGNNPKRLFTHLARKEINGSVST